MPLAPRRSCIASAARSVPGGGYLPETKRDDFCSEVSTMVATKKLCHMSHNDA